MILYYFKDVYQTELPVSEWKFLMPNDTQSIFDKLKADLSKSFNLVNDLALRLQLKRQELCHICGYLEPDPNLSNVDCLIQPKQSNNRHRRGVQTRNATLVAIQNSCALDQPQQQQSSDVSYTSQSLVLNSLRTAWEKFHTDWLIHISHLIKPLGQYELIRANLIQEIKQLKPDDARLIKNNMVWCAWLERYQKWSGFIRSGMKKLSKLLTHATLPRNWTVGPNITDVIPQIDPELNEEVQLASEVYYDLLSIKCQIKDGLVSSILNSIYDTIGQDSEFAQFLNDHLLSTLKVTSQNEEEMPKFGLIEDDDFKLLEVRQVNKFHLIL